MGNIAPRWAKIAKMWQHRPHTVSKRERERETETETETETDRKIESKKETKKDTKKDTYTRAVSPLPH